MRWLIGVLVVGVVGLSLGLAAPPAEATCRLDSVRSGDGCIDKYEASVWKTTNARLISKIRLGIARLADLTAAGAIQLGFADGDLVAAGCLATGNGCVDFYAVSIPGVTPSAFINWFQAAAAARNAWKRLPTNAEWQAAALGTPDPGGSPGTEDCKTDGSSPDLTGVRSNCVSTVGAFDMVGNLFEWVADWVPLSTDCPGWGGFSDDLMCLAGANTTAGPGALIRGGSFFYGADAGVFAVSGQNPPSITSSDFGFRAAR
jgi:hypothetical protein